MDLVRLKAIVEAYGADPKRWPVTERAAAEALVAGNAAAAAAVLAEGETLDAALGEVARLDQRDCQLLTARILRRRPVAWALDRDALMGLAACAVLGLLAGYGGALLAPPSDFGFDLADVFASGEGG